MSVVSSVFEWTKQPDQMDCLSDEEKGEFLYRLIKGLKDGKIRILEDRMYIDTFFGGKIIVDVGDMLFLVKVKNYGTFISSSPRYFFDQMVGHYQKEAGNDSTYSIACV